MSETKPLTEQTPCEIDTQLAAIYERFFRTRMRESQYEQRVMDARDGRKLYGQSLEEIEAAWAKVRAERKAIQDEMTPFENEFARRGGWRRYYLVPGGHVHRERSCSTCHWNTQFGWLVNLADCDESAMVQAHGDAACAVCFPEVQTHPDFLRAKALREAREAAEAATLCPNSGKFSGQCRRYAECPGCQLVVSVTKNGLFRKHTSPAPKTT